MAKEDDLKIIEMKVSVNCCEGCKRKVLKALSIRGVLKTEIHPTLPKVTVLGTVDVQTLVKKLAKCGKAAEVCRVESQKPAAAEQRPEQTNKQVDTGTINGKDKENNTKDPEKSISEAATGSDFKEEARSSNIQDASAGDEDGSKKGGKGTKETDASGEASFRDAPKSIYPAVVTTIPPVNCIINQGTVESPPTLVAYHARAYYQMEPYTIHPMAYYTVSTYSTATPCCMREHYHCEYPVYRTPPQLMHSQATGFADYFNDENPVGCRIM